MEPFRIAAPILGLTDPYLEPMVIVDAAKKGGDPARTAFARLWLSEGIPYAFRGCPAVYESLRTWLSAWLGVHAKEIGVSGSARIGASLAPGKLGIKFGNHSDLDLFIVSPTFFQDMREEFRTWSFDYECSRVAPRNDREAAFWSDNNARGPKVIDRGFIDQKMIPNLPEYPLTKKISQGMWLLVEKLKKTPGAPQPSTASMRCYASWDSFVRQVVLSLS